MSKKYIKKTVKVKKWWLKSFAEIFREGLQKDLKGIKRKKVVDN